MPPDSIPGNSGASVLSTLAEWNALKGTNTAKLLLELVGDDRETQRIAWDALDYTLLSIGADRPENYGNAKILLANDDLIHIVPVLAKIVEIDTFNWLSKYFALGLLWDIYNFASFEQESYPKKAERIRKLIASFTPIYESQLNHKIQEIRLRLQRLLERIRD